MSEEILKALAQLFAIVTKQDGGATEKERYYVISSFKKKLNLDTVNQYVALYDSFVGYGEEKKVVEGGDENAPKKERLTSVKDSVKTLAICKKINKTLTQKQKVVVVTELLEMVKSNMNLSPQRMQIVHTVAEAFNIDKDEYKSIETFVLEDNLKLINDPNVLIINSEFPEEESSDYLSKYSYSEYIEGTLLFLRLLSEDMIFLRYRGHHEITLNGIHISEDDVTLFSHGSIVKSPKGSTFYYSDVLAHFMSALREVNLTFNVIDLEFRFPNNAIGLREITISENSGNLIGIMGASGAGKTTLLNVMAGIEKPFKGEVLLNGINIHTEKEKIQGAFGYIAQDDLLIEELSVFENLYYNAKLCFGNLSNEEIVAKVDKVLKNLDLFHIRDLEVGSPINKKISGGQRKRLNIALELIREPSVLFVDEPTSGLSSRDSENVIDLLKELSLKGTLLFVVIHQPSSDIYKMFDKLYVLDKGGYFIFNGHPIDAISYFKRTSHQADSEHGQCNTCGNVNVEQLFNIIEEKVVDEYGHFTPHRKITPPQWNDLFKQNFPQKAIIALKEAAPKVLEIPSMLQQLLIFITRDLKAKISNKQYMVINTLEAALLALILSFIIRYNNAPNSTEYIYRYNENIPAYILMSIVVALFMGLSISAEEIIKDRKILKRESLLNLSRFSYLLSKLAILFSFSAFQTLTFVLVGNSILEIKAMTLEYWVVLFSISCMANVLGLLISSAFDTAVTVYIMIPILLIPQMILSGAMFNFEKINSIFGNKEKVPIVADFMASRWAFEALSVNQFKQNQYEKHFYDAERVDAIADFNLVYLLPELLERIKFMHDNLTSTQDSVRKVVSNDLDLLKYELGKQLAVNTAMTPQYLNGLSISTLKNDDLETLESYIYMLEDNYKTIFNDASKKKDAIEAELETNNHVEVLRLKNEYFNESLYDLVTNSDQKKRIKEIEHRIIPKVNAIYFNPLNVTSKLDYRSHFYAPKKHFLGNYFDTMLFNILVIWSMTLLFFIGLYFDILKRGLGFFKTIKLNNE